MNSSLIDVLLSDQKKAANIYKPGPYWMKKTLSAIRELKNNGIVDFRASNDKNTVATSFGDNSVIDGRRIIETTTLSNRIGLFILQHTSLKKLFDWQVNRTRQFYKELVNYRKNKLSTSNPERFLELINNWKIVDSINFGCDSISRFEDKEYSTYYLSILDILDNVEKNSSLKEVNSILEIGPGFGANLHLIEQNYPNIRKFIIIDIVPNLCVSTEYLKKIYSDSVIDYLSTRKMKEIKFKEDNSLEIFVIPPWEIEKIASSSIDCFWNSNSFVEMNSEIIKNYGKNFARMRSKKAKYVFTSYSEFDLKTTLDPNTIPNHFPDMSFKKWKKSRFVNNESENYFMIGTLNDQ